MTRRRGVSMTGAARRGMTLVELLVALVVTGFALVAGYEALTTVIDRRTEANTTVNGVARAATVRRTLVEWLQHGQVQTAVGGIANVGGSLGSGLVLGNVGTDNDELHFVTTAPTPLHVDSTVVDLYVNPAGETSADGMMEPAGLVAFLTPTIGAQRAMQTAGTENSAPGADPFARQGVGSGQGSPFGNDLLGLGDAEDAASMVVPLDSTVTGLQVDCLMQPAPGGQQQTTVPPQWVPLSSVAGLHGAAAILAVRLTLQSSSDSALQPVLRLPIVAVMWSGR